MDERRVRSSAIQTASGVYRPLGTFRFFLAALVVVSHLRYLAGPSLDVIGPLGLGNPAVMTFFVMSGYIIAEALAMFYSGRPGAFLINRFLRIHPPFFVALALGVLVHWWLAQNYELEFFDVVTTERMFDAGNLIANSLRLIVIYGNGILRVPPTEYVFVRFDWAVAIEVQFYITMALLVWLAPKSRFYWPAAAVLFIVAFVVSMNTRWIYGSGWIPYFVLGIAIYHRRYSLAAVALAMVNWHAAVYIGRNADADVVGALVILNVLIAALWILSRCRIAPRLKKLDSWFGDLTYPLYLNHYTVGIVMLTLFRPSPAVFALTFIGSVAFSYAAMMMAEPLTRRLRDRIRGRRL